MFYKKSTLIFAFTLLICAGLYFIMPGPEPVQAASYPGKAVFDQSCNFCHGKKGYGNGILKGLFLKNPKELQVNKYTTGFLRKKLKARLKTRGNMRHFTSYVQQPSQFDSLSTFISSGSSITGKILYQNSCQACHGSKGNGQGIITGFKKPPPNLKNVAAAELTEKIKGSRSKQISLLRQIPHIRNAPDNGQLEALIEYINSFED